LSDDGGDVGNDADPDFKNEFQLEVHLFLR
jgi:hypothetical protein